jgi:hypothetical protein
MGCHVALGVIYPNRPFVFKVCNNKKGFQPRADPPESKPYVFDRWRYTRRDCLTCCKRLGSGREISRENLPARILSARVLAYLICMVPPYKIDGKVLATIDPGQHSPHGPTKLLVYLC